MSDSQRLRRLVMTRRDDGQWELVRQRDGSGESFTEPDLMACFATVRAAYMPDGTPREWPAKSRSWP